MGYHDACEQDESPLYLFESEFVEKTVGASEGLGDDYEVPLCFREDLFEVMGAERPDYRWLVILLLPPRIAVADLENRLSDRLDPARLGIKIPTQPPPGTQ